MMILGVPRGRVATSDGSHRVCCRATGGAGALMGGLGESAGLPTGPPLTAALRPAGRLPQGVPARPSGNHDYVIFAVTIMLFLLIRSPPTIM